MIIMKITSKKSLEAVVVCAIAAIACFFLAEANVPPLSIFSWTAMEYFFLGMEIYGAYHFIQKAKEEKAESKARKLAKAAADQIHTQTPATYEQAEAEVEAKDNTKAEAEAREAAAIAASKKEAHEAAVKAASSKAEEIISEARKEVELSSAELNKDFGELKLRYISARGAVVTLCYLQSLEGKKLEYNQATGNFRIYAWDSTAHKGQVDIALTKHFDICMSGKTTDLMGLPVDESFIGEYIEKAIEKLSHDAALAIMTIEEKILPSTGSEPAPDATDSSYTEMTDISVIMLKPEEL